MLKDVSVSRMDCTSAIPTMKGVSVSNMDCTSAIPTKLNQSDWLSLAPVNKHEGFVLLD